MIAKQNIYLAGTIYGEPIHRTWKVVFSARLDRDYFSTYDPDPAMEALTPDTIARDKQIIDRCDIVVAYIARATFGTTMEIFYAYSKGNKPVYVIDATEKGNLCDDLWLRGHCHRIFKASSYNEIELCADYINENMKKYV